MARQKSNGTPVKGKSVGQVLDEAKQKELEISDSTTALAVGSNGTMEIVEADWHVIDVAVTAEIVNTMSGVFVQEVVYNKPAASKSGKTEWKACDRMPNGYCYYRSKKIPHVHILGIGIKGAMVAMNVYGGLKVVVSDMPQLINFADRPYWVCEVSCEDTFRNNYISRWIFEPHLNTTKSGGLYENLQAMHIVQSKGIRNLVLAAIPQAVQSRWIQDYLDGREPFDPQRVVELGARQQGQVGKGSSVSGPALPPGKGKPKDKPAPKNNAGKEKEKKKQPQTGGQQDLKTMCAEFAKKAEADVQDVLDWTSMLFDDPGTATTALVQAMASKAHFGARLDQFKKWKEEKEESAGDTPPPDQASDDQPPPVNEEPPGDDQQEMEL